MKALNLRSIILFLFASVLYNSGAQEDFDFKEWFVEAESYFLFEEYADALPLYQRLLREDADNSNINFKIGICYLNDPYQLERAVKYLLEASENITEDYKSNNYKERFAPPEVNYYLGQAYRVTGSLNKALEYYRLFKKSLDPEIFDIEVVDAEIASCKVAKKMLLNPVYKEAANSGSDINSRFAESNPVISGDGNTIVFNRKLQFYNAVFITKKDDKGNWSPPYNLTSDFQLDGNSYCAGLSYKGDEIFIYRSDNFDGNIYSSRLSNEIWQPLKKLKGLINTKYWESHASPSPDGKYLYFTSNRKGGYGGLDIYRSKRLSNGDWGVPVNLGPTINSPYNEDCPFISPNDNKLFFSSLGHQSMGGYDIFASEMVGPETWSKPVNMGYPVNTTADDLFFCPTRSEDYVAIYAMYDPNTTLGLTDIYFLKVFNSVLPRKFNVIGQVKIPVPDLAENSDVMVSIFDTKEGKIISQIPLEQSGDFMLEASQGEYQLLIDGKGIKPVSIPLTLLLTQKDDKVILPEILIEEVLSGEEQQSIASSKMPEIEIIGQDYIITDSIPILINLKLETGNDLIVETYVDENLKSKEEYLIKKEDFAYQFTPEEGMNRVVFTIRDKNGNIVTKEVQVNYVPKDIPKQFTDVEEDYKKPANLNEIALLAGNRLSAYLEGTDDLEYSSLTELYARLLENAKENNYTAKDVDRLFAVMLTQRDKKEFIEQLSRLEIDLDLENPEIDGYDYPIAILRLLKPDNIDSLFLFEEEILYINPTKFEGPELFEYLISFSQKDKGTGSESQYTEQKIYGGLVAGLGLKQAEVIVDKASTTRELEQFYFNLLLSASPELKNILSEIDFNSKNIVNAITLVNYLFDKAEAGEISAIDLIGQIERSLQEEKQNITLFKEALANAATGELKVNIQELETKEKSPEITGVIENILNNVNTKGYSKVEVYDLLINMIGLKEVGLFIEEMRNYASGDMDSLLLVVDKNQMSTPLEIIQYLLSVSPYFDFSDSDINSLLIRMILEKGVEGHGLARESSYSKKLIGKNRFITSLVLVNVLIIILLIIFWRRKKKKQ